MEPWNSVAGKAGGSLLFATCGLCRFNISSNAFIKGGEEMEIPMGIYRFTDSLKYLKIRITLRKITSSLLWDSKDEKDVGQKEFGKSLLMKQHSTDADRPNVESYTFSWQEKVFSQTELEWYSEKRNYKGFLDSKYHQDVIEKRGHEENMTKRLFSYTNADIAGREVDESSMASGHKDYFALLGDEISTLRLRHGTSNYHQRLKTNSTFTKPSVVSTKPASKKFSSLPTQCMYIMADIQPQIKSSDSSGSCEEVILCKIEVDSNGVLRVTPDFTHDAPHNMQNSRDEKFEYRIENASREMTKKDVEEEKQFKNQLYRKYLDFIKSSVGSEFHMPPHEVVKFSVFGEIVSAVGFSGSNLCLFYYVDLPKNWHSDDSSWLTGVTQRCKTTVEQYEDVAYFSFPLEGELTLKLGNIDHDDVSITPPTLLMEVLSYDIWECVRTEGYGHVSLPLLPGSYDIEVSTWRPLGSSVTSNLQYYFTGGLLDLEDMSYIAVPNTFEGKQLSKLGFTTETSGRISLRLHITQQSRYFMKTGNRKSDLLDKLTTHSQDSIALVLSAFQRARQRMLAARQKILTSK